MARVEVEEKLQLTPIFFLPNPVTPENLFSRQNRYYRQYRGEARNSVNSPGDEVVLMNFPHIPITNTAVKRNAHVRDLRKARKNKGKLYTKECGLNKTTKNKKTPENIR